MRRTFAFTAAVVLAASVAQADLCPKCKGKMYIMSVGKCVACGGHTSSGAHKLCRKCSAKLGQCEHCRAKINGGAAKPAPVRLDWRKSGKYTSGKWRYAYQARHPGTRSERVFGVLTFDGQPVPGAEQLDRIQTPWGMMQYFGPKPVRFGGSGWLLRQGSRSPIDPTKGRLLPTPHDKVTAARVKKLKADVHAFTLELRYVGPQDKPFPGLTLRVAFPKEGPVPMGVQITKEEARAVIDHLASDGFLSRAINVAQTDIRPPRGPTYTLRVGGPDDLVLFESLGWNAKMIGRLDALGKALTGDAAKAMDAVLARLAGLKKQWETRR